MKIDLVEIVNKIYKQEGEPKNVNKVFALSCLQELSEQLSLTDVSYRRELLIDAIDNMTRGDFELKPTSDYVDEYLESINCS